MYRKIAIVIMTLKDNKSSYAYHVNLEYSNKYKYDFFIEYCIDYENKFEIYTKYLSNYHYILFITDDNLIFKNDISIESFIDKYFNDEKEKHVILLSSDWNEHFLNSKILLIKNCLTSFEIIKYWDTYANIVDELNIGYEMYSDNLLTIKFDIFDNIDNFWSTYLYSNSFISKNIIAFGFVTTLFFYKFVLKF